MKPTIPVLQKKIKTLREALVLARNYTSELSHLYGNSTETPQEIKDEVLDAIKKINEALKL